MENIKRISKRVDCEERSRILVDAVLSLSRISDRFLRRANAENVPDDKVINILNYMLSDESFKELESYWFYLYDPWDPEQWEKILDHVYRRSITDNHLMN